MILLVMVAIVKLKITLHDYACFMTSIFKIQSCKYRVRNLESFIFLASHLEIFSHTDFGTTLKNCVIL